MKIEGTEIGGICLNIGRKYKRRISRFERFLDHFIEPRHHNWPIGYPVPYQCSRCGSIRAEDLITLVGNGWRAQPVTSHRIFIIRPPIDVRLRLRPPAYFNIGHADTVDANKLATTIEALSIR